ncbi:expansin family protein [Russula earlei]|uniref:Expansin family protein n=1 Tax=Russula earlei TaxID=71964 RepID=A0ACC0U5I0_9AGAM|nr:expansin family protein [Russula earlei]
MYRLTWILFAFLSLVLSALAIPVPVPQGIVSPEKHKRTTHSGRGTWYYPGLGNCGGTNNQNQFVVAIAKSFYDQTNGSNCYKNVQITHNGQTVSAQIVDSCQSCGPNDLDMSPATFKALAPLSVGVIPISWTIS